MRFKVTVKMKKPWVLVSEWSRKPDLDRILEALADEILDGKLDDYFEITVEAAEKIQKS